VSARYQAKSVGSQRLAIQDFLGTVRSSNVVPPAGKHRVQPRWMALLVPRTYGDMGMFSEGDQTEDSTHRTTHKDN